MPSSILWSGVESERCNVEANKDIYGVQFSYAMLLYYTIGDTAINHILVLPYHRPVIGLYFISFLFAGIRGCSIRLGPSAFAFPTSPRNPGLF